MPVSNLGRSAEYRDCELLWFFSVLPGPVPGFCLQLDHDRFLQRPFQFIIHSHPAFQHCVISITDSVVDLQVNKQMSSVGDVHVRGSLSASKTVDERMSAAQ